MSLAQEPRHRPGEPAADYQKRLDEERAAALAESVGFLPLDGYIAPVSNATLMGRRLAALAGSDVILDLALGAAFGLDQSGVVAVKVHGGNPVTMPGPHDFYERERAGWCWVSFGARAYRVMLSKVRGVFTLTEAAECGLPEEAEAEGDGSESPSAQ